MAQAPASPSPFLRPTESRSAIPLVTAFVLVVLGGLLGFAIAMGELDSFFIVVTVIAAAAILFDFRIGAVLLMLLLPAEPSVLFPHSLMGVTGLNPINLLLFATLVSFLFRLNENRLGAIVPKQLLWLFVVPIVVGGLLGTRHVDEIPLLFEDTGVINFADAWGYLRDWMLKPLFLVIAAVLVGGAVARSQKPERFIAPIIASVWTISLFVIGWVLVNRISLAELSSASSRHLLSATGMHANDLGRLFAVAYALLLFTWAETKSRPLKALLVATMGVLVVSLILTFSRGAFLGFMIVNLLFLAWKFNAKTVALGALVVMLALVLLPGAFFDRMSLGFDSGNPNEVSAGRVDGIWLPLLPEVLKSPLWGTGLGSTMWSEALRQGTMLQVVHPHNAYLEALLDVGLIGLALLVAYFVHVWKGFRDLGSNAYLSPTMRGFYQGAAAGLVSFAVTGIAGSSLQPRPEYTYLWLAIGMMYGQLARKPAS